MSKKTILPFLAFILLCIISFVLTVNGKLELGLVIYLLIGILVQLRYKKHRVLVILFVFIISTVSEFIFICILHSFALSKAIKDIFMTGFRNSIIVAVGILVVYSLKYVVKVMGSLKTRNK